MQVEQAIALIVGLAGEDDRAARASVLAAALGVDDLVVFLHDAEVDALLPAPRWRKTLPGGAEWREFLRSARADGMHRAVLPWAGVASPVVACAAQGLAIVFVGGCIGDGDAKLVCSMAPLLKAALSAQHALLATKAELASAHSEIREAAALMKALDETRVKLDRSLIELDQQARSLEQARARAERATRAKDEFMAMLGHELRNPLAPIKTALALLKMKDMWSHEHDVIQRQVNHMIRLVEDLLDVSRIAGGKLALQRSPVLVAAVIARAVETASPLIDERRQNLEIDAEDEQFHVLGDLARLAQVFSNLLTNAAKYSDKGSSIKIHVQRAEDRVRICVRDQGIGIEPGRRDEIFDLFHQEGRGLDRAQGGLGLGLAIVRNLVHLHGGTVEAHSDGPGRGSSFVVELPLCHPENPGATTPAANDPRIALAPSRPLRILLVDDNVDARETLALALASVGHHVDTAGEGFEALARAAAHPPDIAVLDIGLPVMDGYELARRLRQGAARPIVLIALTGYGQENDKALSKSAGFAAHFVKPVDLNRLLEAIDALAESDRLA